MLSKEIDSKIIEARKNKNHELLGVLQLIKAAFMRKVTEPGHKSHDLTEEEENKILLKMIKEHEDSISQYTAGNRMDLANNEKKELEIINTFAPKQVSNEDVEKYTRIVISTYITTKEDSYKLSMKDMGPIMKLVKAKYSMADGNVVRKTLMSVINS